MTADATVTAPAEPEAPPAVPSPWPLAEEVLAEGIGRRFYSPWPGPPEGAEFTPETADEAERALLESWHACVPPGAGEVAALAYGWHKEAAARMYEGARGPEGWITVPPPGASEPEFGYAGLWRPQHAPMAGVLAADADDMARGQRIEAIAHAYAAGGIDSDEAARRLAAEADDDAQRAAEKNLSRWARPGPAPEHPTTEMTAVLPAPGEGVTVWNCARCGATVANIRPDDDLCGACKVTETAEDAGLYDEPEPDLEEQA